MTDYKQPGLVLETDGITPGQVIWQSPSNLAIVKYWGKHGVQLPRNPSISLTLSTSFTETSVSYRPKENGDPAMSVDFLFHGEPQEAFRLKIVRFLEHVTDAFPFLRQLHLDIRSANAFPHSAGIASSASAMSALALCICSLEHELFGTLEDDQAFDRKSSWLARLGSGSACRSIYPVAALWGRTGEVPDASDDYAVPLADRVHPIFRDFHDDILLASTAEKSVSSRAGHSLMDNHPFAESRYADARKNLHFLLSAMRTGDLETFGSIAEREALTLHGLMMSSNPSYILLKSNTLEMIERVRQYRSDTKHPVFFSLDAGPNLHLLYPENIIHEVRPFIDQELAPRCEQGAYLQDWVGEGPVQA